MTQKCSLQPASWFCGRAYRPALAESFLLSVHRRQLSVMRHTWSYILYRQRDILALHKKCLQCKLPALLCGMYNSPYKRTGSIFEWKLGRTNIIFVKCFCSEQTNDLLNLSVLLTLTQVLSMAWSRWARWHLLLLGLECFLPLFSLQQ